MHNKIRLFVLNRWRVQGFVEILRERAGHEYVRAKEIPAPVLQDLRRLNSNSEFQFEFRRTRRLDARDRKRQFAASVVLEATKTQVNVLQF